MKQRMEQLSLFPESVDMPAPEMAFADPRPPVTITWNGIHGCTKASTGCAHCYMFRRDESVGKDPTIVRKTQSFNLPVRRLRRGEYKGLYKIPTGSYIYTCFSSDFFHADADEWRDEMWDMIRERSDCTFFMITKRPERIADHLPSDWGDGWEHVTIAVTCENQWAADKRLPVYLSLPLRHRSIMIEPMLTPVDLRSYFRDYTFTDSAGMAETARPLIENVSVGGESGPDARACDYGWVLDLHCQCVEHNVPFYFHQTGAKLKRGERIYEIPRELQHEQARKAGLDYAGVSLGYDGVILPAWDEPGTL